MKQVLTRSDTEWAEQQYRLIKRHAIAQTQFYKSFSETDRFPVMNKQLLMKEYEAHTAKAGFLTPLHTSSTSGSTGIPFSILQDYKKRNRTIADLKVFGELCDYPSHERMLFLRVLSAKLNRTPQQEDCENIYYIDSSDLSEAHLQEMVEAILEKKPRIIFSYSSTLVELARHIARRKIPADAFSMQSVLTGGEGISEQDRRFLARTFGCKAYRRYSDMELGILGQDDGNGGAYMLNWGSYYFECLKQDSDEAAEDGEVGRIVITDLFNYAFPMIRYDTGDLGIMEHRYGEMPRLAEIYGRSRDCVYRVDGTMLSPAKISVVMWGLENIKQWQFVQEDQKRYILKLNCSKKADCAAIVDKLKTVLGEAAEIEMQFVDEIPVEASNKRRAVICNYRGA